jgi:hypothetical protein
MISSDYNTMAASTSNHCNTIEDTGCEAATNAVIPTLQRWVGDLNSFPTPARFVAIDGQLRAHLNEVITELNAAVAFQKAKDQTGFDLAMGAAVFERAWVDPTTFVIEGHLSTVGRFVPRSDSPRAPIFGRMRKLDPRSERGGLHAVIRN